MEVREHAPEYTEQCVQRAVLGIVTTLQHDDLRVVSDLAGLEPGATELLRLRDAYLGACGHDRDVLVEAARLAVRVDGVSRADCYRRGTMEWDGHHRSPFGEGVPAWLKEQRGPMPI